MLNIDLGIRAGNESLIHEQLNDPICKKIESVYDKVCKISRLYFKNKSISKREFDHEFKIIAKEFNNDTYDRFGIHINLRNSNTFAIIPIFNPDQLDVSSFKVKQTDVNHGIKQIRDFTKWLDNNELILDKKEAKFMNMPLGYYVPLFVASKHMTSLTKDEFVSIILHEIGHVFTLLEMYTKTSLTTSILLTNFLRNKTITDTSKDLKISKTPKSTGDGLNLIFDKIGKDIREITLGGSGTGSTDHEYEADNFTVKFGYGSYLSKALIKMNEVDALTFSNAGAIITLMSVVGIAFKALLLSLLVPGGMAIMLAIGIEIALTIKKLTELVTMHSGRNPINDEHGSLKQRLDTIKTSIIEVIRNTKTNKSDTKLLLKQYDLLIEDINKVENSAHGKILIGLLSEYLVGNLNTEDELMHAVNNLENNKLYIHEARFSVGLESIKYQGKKDPVIKELITFFAKLKDNSIVRNTATFMKLKTELEDITYNRFGISIFALPAFGTTGGWACMPFNVIRQKGINNWKQYFTKSTINPIDYILYLHSNREIMKDFKNGHSFTLDMDKAYIKGMDRDKHRNIMFIEFGRDQFGTQITGWDLTPEEMTAVYLHEIGHLFTYFESLNRTIVSNSMLLDSFIKNKHAVKDIKIKYRDIYDNDAKEMLTLKGYSLGLIKGFLVTGFRYITNFIQVVDPSFAGAILTSNITRDNRLGGIRSSMTDSEVLADDFSTRMGMGRELASGLDRLITLKIHNKALILLPLLIYVISGVLTHLIFVGRGKELNKFAIILLATIKYMFLAYALNVVYRIVVGQYFNYEKFPERIDSIERSLIKALREEKIDKATTREIIKTIDAVRVTQKEILDAGYGSYLLSVFVPNPNVGKDIKPDAFIIDSLDKLINNDMVYHALKFEDIQHGNEAMSDNIKLDNAPSIYYTELRLWSDRVIDILVNNDLNKFNSIIGKYGLAVDKIKEYLYLKCSDIMTVADGYTGFTIFNTEPDKRDTVITVTIDTDKIIWLLRNPYIKVFNLDSVNITNDKTIYIIEVEYLHVVTKEEHVDSFNAVNRKLNEVIKDYGTKDVPIILKYLKDSLQSESVTSEVTEQLELISTIVKEEDLVGKLRLDLHSGNWGVNGDGKLTVFDPLVNDTGLGLKINNEIDISKYKKYLEDIKPGVEHLDALDRN